MSSLNSSFRGQALSNRSRTKGTSSSVGENVRKSQFLITMQKQDTVKLSPAPNKSNSIETKTTSLPIGTRENNFRSKLSGGKRPPKLLSKVQELRLLSKLESAGLLSQLEKSGVTLAKIEKAGLLTTAEKFGLLSAASDRQTPSLLFTVAFVLFVLGPSAVYLIPDKSNVLIAVQVVIVSIGAFGGAAAFGGATLLSTLQE